MHCQESAAQQMQTATGLGIDGAAEVQYCGDTGASARRKIQIDSLRGQTGASARRKTQIDNLRGQFRRISPLQGVAILPHGGGLAIIPVELRGSVGGILTTV
jgi:hypothetical protein